MEQLPENVFCFPGVDRAELAAALGATQDVQAKRVLRSAMRAKIQDVIVIGEHPDGSFFLASQDEDFYSLIGKLQAALTYMTIPDYQEVAE
jgi:hypothetical protein